MHPSLRRKVLKVYDVKPELLRQGRDSLGLDNGARRRRAAPLTDCDGGAGAAYRCGLIRELNPPY